MTTPFAQLVQQKEGLPGDIDHPNISISQGCRKDALPHVDPSLFYDSEHSEQRQVLAQLLSPEHRCLFPEIEHLNRMQQVVFSQLYHDHQNMLISAPTSSGKTLLFDFAILRAISRFPSHKVIYMAPTRALCNEKYNYFRSRFQDLHLRVALFTGDSKSSWSSVCSSATIVVTTPEKIDSLSRKNMSIAILDSFGLMLLDEIHSVGDKHRGPCLEAVVCRIIKRCSLSGSAVQQHSKNQHDPFRIVAVSATIPNVTELGRWLLCDKDHVAVFDDSYRPVPVEVLIRTYPHDARSNVYVFEQQLKFRLPELVAKHALGKPALIFCGTRKSTVATAQYLAAEHLRTLHQTYVNQTLPHGFRIQDALLRTLVPVGFAFHNAALCTEDRNAVETLFTQGHIKALTCTSTLSQGINLPAHLVIICGTTVWDSSTSQQEEIPDAMITQMIGRAGRPQFDRFATAIVMTTPTRGQALANMKLQAIESHLQDNLAEFLNAEIVLGEITNVESALLWLKTTYYFQRIAGTAMENSLQTLLLQYVDILSTAGIIDFDDNNFTLTPTVLGKEMSHAYIRHETSTVFIEAVSRLKEEEQFWRLIASCKELSEIRLRRNGEKKTLLAYGKKRVLPFKITSLKTDEDKRWVLMQLRLRHEALTDTAHRHEVMQMFEVLPRVSNFLYSICQLKGTFTQASVALKVAMECHAQRWSGPNYSLLGLPGIGDINMLLLQQAGIKTLQDMTSANAALVEAILNRRSPFGMQLVEMARQTPCLKITCHQDAPWQVKSTDSCALVVSLAMCPLEGEAINMQQPLNVQVVVGSGSIDAPPIFSGKIRLHRAPVTLKLPSIIPLQHGKLSRNIQITAWIMGHLHQNFHYEHHIRYTESLFLREDTPIETPTDTIPAPKKENKRNQKKRSIQSGKEPRIKEHLAADLSFMQHTTTSSKKSRIYQRSETVPSQEHIVPSSGAQASNHSGKKPPCPHGVHCQRTSQLHLAHFDHSTHPTQEAEFT